MKKSFFYLMVILLSMIAVPAPGFANEINYKNNMADPEEVPLEVQIMLDRIFEIKEMDKSELSREERRELRKEVREIRKEVRSSRSGIFISTGAIIIILLLIIIL